VLSADEQKLYSLAFSSLRPREFLSLVLAGEWKDAVAGDKLLSEGQEARQICIPIEGLYRTRPVYELADRQLA
jgi:hypothetical protein